MMVGGEFAVSRHGWFQYHVVSQFAGDMTLSTVQVPFARRLVELTVVQLQGASLPPTPAFAETKVPVTRTPPIGTALVPNEVGLPTLVEISAYLLQLESPIASTHKTAKRQDFALIVFLLDQTLVCEVYQQG
jgi:hypothetical protein